MIETAYLMWQEKILAFSKHYLSRKTGDWNGKFSIVLLCCFYVLWARNWQVNTYILVGCMSTVHMNEMTGMWWSIILLSSAGQRGLSLLEHEETHFWFWNARLAESMNTYILNLLIFQCRCPYDYPVQHSFVMQLCGQLSVRTNEINKYLISNIPINPLSFVVKNTTALYLWELENFMDRHMTSHKTFLYHYLLSEYLSSLRLSSSISYSSIERQTYIYLSASWQTRMPISASKRLTVPLNALWADWGILLFRWTQI